MTSAVRGKRSNLVVKISNDLVSRMSSGEYVVGDKLPSESSLAERYSVSRTVVREAIASLRLGGLVQTQQGSGAFVAKLPGAASTNGFRPIDLQKISSVIEGLEMRLAMEVEAAALAAERRSPVQAAKIMEALEAYRLDVEKGESPFKSDFLFHVAVSNATNNPRFVEFLDLMEASITPSGQLDGPMSLSRNDKSYFDSLYEEHRKIAEAIHKSDVDGARQAMRAHITGTIARYAGFLTR